MHLKSEPNENAFLTRHEFFGSRVMTLQFGWDETQQRYARGQKILEGVQADGPGAPEDGEPEPLTQSFVKPLGLRFRVGLRFGIQISARRMFAFGNFIFLAMGGDESCGPAMGRSV